MCLYMLRNRLFHPGRPRSPVRLVRDSEVEIGPGSFSTFVGCCTYAYQSLRIRLATRYAAARPLGSSVCYRFEILTL